MSRSFWALLLIVSIGLGVNAQTQEAPKVVNPNSVGVGRLVANATLTNLNGQTAAIQGLLNKNGLVIAFTNTTCPICKKYANTLAKLHQTLDDQGIGLILVNPTANAKPEEVRQFVKQHQLQSPYFMDSAGTFARQLGATSTAEVFLLDSKRTLVYRGAIDDQYGLGYNLDAPKHQFLLSAVQRLRSQFKIDPAATTAPGCELDLSHAKADPTKPITYHNRISRIIQSHCIECHRTDGVGPFKLETYEEVVAQAGMIRKVVDKGTMPPWFAAPSRKDQPTHWANDRTMPKADKDDLLNWLKSDRPQGDASEAPLPKSYKSGWNIGQPDAIFEFTKPVAVKANGTMPYQNIIVESKLSEDKWVKAIEVRPSAPDVVHHVLVFALAPNDDAQIEDERAGFFAAYVPGQSTFIYPEGLAKKLPKGTRFRFQMHYTPNGTATKDSTKLGVVFADKPPQNEIHVVGIANPRIQIKAGADNHPEYASLKIPHDATLLAFMPHMHLRGKAFRYELTTTKGTTTLLDIPQYDFNWQLYYRLAEPLALKPGMELKATGWFDNSSKNPANPDPTKVVYWGPQTSDEMMLGYIEYYVPVGQHQSMVQARAAIDAESLFKKIDVNKDGKISRAEYDLFMKLLPRFRGNPEQLDELFQRLDTDKDGSISLEELKKLPGVRR